MKKFSASLFAILILISGCAKTETEQGSKPVVNLPYIPTTEISTDHYRIHSSATPEETKAIAAAAEALYQAYASIFPKPIPGQKYQLVLYKDQVEFKQNNRSSSWAEAYYSHPRSFAYPGSGDNPYHWMLHEATHQLLREAGGYKLNSWLNEGIASYFGSSSLHSNTLRLGEPDTNAYPIWWLPAVESHKDLATSFQGSELLRLQQLVEGNGPPISENVNHYYVAYWSLVHYLLQGDNGSHREAFLVLVARGGGPESFKQLIGPYSEIEPRWQSHLSRLAKSDSR